MTMSQDILIYKEQEKSCQIDSFEHFLWKVKEDVQLGLVKEAHTVPTWRLRQKDWNFKTW